MPPASPLAIALAAAALSWRHRGRCSSTSFEHSAPSFVSVATFEYTLCGGILLQSDGGGQPHSGWGDRSPAASPDRTAEAVLPPVKNVNIAASTSRIPCRIGVRGAAPSTSGRRREHIMWIVRPRRGSRSRCQLALQLAGQLTLYRQQRTLWACRPRTEHLEIQLRFHQ